MTRFHLRNTRRLNTSRKCISTIRRINRRTRRSRSTNLLLASTTQPRVRRLLLIRPTNHANIPNANRVANRGLRIQRQVDTKAIIRRRIPISLMDLNARDINASGRVTRPSATYPLTLRNTLRRRITTTIKLQIISRQAIFRALPNINRRRPACVNVAT